MNYEINNIVKYKIYGDYIALYSLEYNGSVVYEEKDLIKKGMFLLGFRVPR